MKILRALSLIASLPPFPLPHTVLTGESAWYGRELRGKPMSNGQPFDERQMTCATWFYPLGTELKVTCVSTGRAVYVRVTDRGPAWRLVINRNRIIDLSRSAFDKIANLNLGHVMVRIERIQKVDVPLESVMSYRVR